MAAGHRDDQMAARAAPGTAKTVSTSTSASACPTLVANFVPATRKSGCRSENGMLGIGPFPTEDQVDADLINAGKQTVTTFPGAPSSAVTTASR